MTLTKRPSLEANAGQRQSLTRGRVLMSGAGRGPVVSADPFTPTAAELELINRQTLRDHTADEVWVVPILACDNQPTEHQERLLIPALEQLAPTFVGRPGLEDHFWSATVQNCRIFDAGVSRDAGEKSKVEGEPYTYLWIKAYALRTPDNAAFRANVEGGILKETSVGFFLDWMEVECSICGGAIYDWWASYIGSEDACSHIPGQEYDGKLCLGLIPAHDGLKGAENSWVAVPAAPRAGAQRTTSAPEVGSTGQMVGMAQFDAEGAELRRSLIARKEQAMTSKELLGILQNPSRLQEALAGEDQAIVGPLVARLAGTVQVQGRTPECCCHSAGKEEANCCCVRGDCAEGDCYCHQDADPEGDPEDAGGNEQHAGHGHVRHSAHGKTRLAAAPADLSSQITAAVQAAVKPLQADLDALKQSVGSKLAPVGQGPLVAGFAAPGQARIQGDPPIQNTIGGRIAGALLAE